MFRSLRLIAHVLVVAVALPALAACGDDGGSDDGGASEAGRVRIEAAFYPLAWIAERVGGQHVSVHSLTEPGAEPHDLELTPSGVADVLDADLVVYLHGFQPAVDDAADQADADRRFDAAEHGADLDLHFTPIEGHDDDGHEGEEHADDDGHDDDDDGHGHEGEAGAVDPHFWLDPTRLAAVAGQLAERLRELDPEHADDFAANAELVQEELARLDAEYAAGLAECASRDLVTSHSAFGYLARRYELTQVGISGLTPEEEPSPADLAAVTEYVREHEVGTIFFEALVSPAVAQTVAAETGASTDILDPLEGLTVESEGDDYLEVMAANLEAIREGLSCP